MHYSIMPDSIFWVGKAGPKLVAKGHPRFQTITDKLLDGEDPTDLADAAPAVRSLDGRISVKGGRVALDGKPLEDQSLEDFIIRMVESGDDDPGPFFLFVASLDRNPSMNSRKQLFSFMQRNGIELYPDGRLRLYKSVTPDFLDWHTRSVPNQVGAKPPAFERRNVDDNPTNHCSFGWHAGSFSYADNFHEGDGRRLIAVAVRAEDVVSVPNDANCAKVRVTQYEVMEDVTGQAQKFAPVYRQDTNTYRVHITADDEFDSYDIVAGSEDEARTKVWKWASSDYDHVESLEITKIEVVEDDDFGGQSEAEPEADLEPKRFRVVLRALLPGLGGYRYCDFEVDADSEEDARNDPWIGDAEIVSVTEL